MDTYIENLFKKNVTLDKVANINRENSITKNTVNNFIKAYDLKLDKNDRVNIFNETYNQVLDDIFKSLNTFAEKRNAKYLSLGDLNNLQTVQNGGSMSVPYADYCHNNITQCSDMYNVGCGQTGGSKTHIPSAVFNKIAHKYSNFVIPKNVLGKLEILVNKKVVNILKK